MGLLPTYAMFRMRILISKDLRDEPSGPWESLPMYSVLSAEMMNPLPRMHHHHHPRPHVAFLSVPWEVSNALDASVMRHLQSLRIQAGHVSPTGEAHHRRILFED